MTLRMEMPELKFAPQTGGGKSWTQLVLPKSDTPAADGKPGIPVISRSFARAGRREAHGRAGQHRVVHDRGRRRVPRPARAAGRQPDPGPAEGRPEQPAEARLPQGLVRAGQVRARRRRLQERLARPGGGGVRPDPRPGARRHDRRPADPGRAVRRRGPHAQGAQHRRRRASTFEGGSKTFTPELELAVGALAAVASSRACSTRGIVKSKLPFVIRRCGEEMLVITNPATQAAADQFAVGKRAQGWRTNVFQTGAGRGPDRHDPGADPDVHPRPARPRCCASIRAT